MKVSVKNLLVAALLLALSIIFYRSFGGVVLFGGYLCAMEIPILLCGLLCGPVLGAIAGAAAPILCSLLFNSPTMNPDAFAIAVEYIVFGVACGIFFKVMCQNVYLSLILSMYLGKTAYGIMMRLLVSYSSASILYDVLYCCIPGIVIEIVLLPLIAILLDRTGLMRRKER